MTSRLFRVDMSEGSRDFMAVATEPGLAMLDGTGANYGIFRRWLGALVAEPELQTPELVSFYVRDPERGRLENVVCSPVTQKDLRGQLKEELEALAAGIRKAKPESSNERLLHKIAAKTLKDQTADLDKSDFDCYFFKYRQPGGTWHLVWCWGYQRRDHEPSRGVICSNPDCHQLFAQRPKTKRRCPACQTISVRKRGPLAGIGLASWLLLLLLAALIGAFFYPPKLVVQPGHWSGPPGSRIDFKVVQQRLWFFNSDVTGRVTPQSGDRRVVEFDQNSTSAHAKSSGQTKVMFFLGDRWVEVAVDVGAAKPPQSIRVEPDSIKVAVGSTAPLKVMGTYADGPAVDVTDMIQWEVTDPKLALVSNGRLQGAAAGKTKLTARYPGSDGAKGVETTSDVEVASVEYKSLEVKVTPAEVSVGEGMYADISGRDADGKSYSLVGSSLLTLVIEPRTAASIEPRTASSAEGEHVVAKAPGKAKLTASLDKLSQSADFSVSGDKTSLAAGTLSVKPSQVILSVGEYLSLDIVSDKPDEVQATSSDPTVATVLGRQTLSAYKEGETEITFTLGTQQQKIKVSVKPVVFTKVEIRPSSIALSVGETRHFDVVGITAEGKSVTLAYDQVKWLRQPQDSNVEVRRKVFEVQGRSTTKVPQVLEVQFGELPPAVANVAVSAGPEVAVQDAWLTYPPVNLQRPGTVLNSSLLGGTARFLPNNGLKYDTIAPGSLLANAGIPNGAIITALDGKDITALEPDAIDRYLKEHPYANNTVVSYTGPDDIKHEVRLGLDGKVSLPVNVLGLATSNVTPTTFDAAIRIHVDENAEYRVVDGAFKPLSPWSVIGPNAEATLNASQIPRTADRLKYDMYVERKIAGDVIRYAFVISLTAGQVNPK